jgi:glycosyltransferase involved in cell wall biosynthesis
MMLVSILIPCYNAEAWIEQSIESALAQTWPDKEVIVIDDGSTDSSRAVIERFGTRIRWETGANKGGAAARNRLLELARGEWLQYLDADDYLLPDKIERQMAFLNSNPGVDVVFSPVILEYTRAEGTDRTLLPIPEPHDPWVLLARWYLPQTGAALWRRSAVVDVGAWTVGQPCCQEHDLYLRLLTAHKQFAYSDHTGAVYRQWSDQTVSKKDIAEVHRRRLQIEQRAEDSLRTTGNLSHERMFAINQARFETARGAWQYDPELASEIMAQVRRCDPGFAPEVGPAAPTRYRLALRLLGFRAAQSLAAWTRVFHSAEPQYGLTRIRPIPAAQKSL